VAPVVCGEEPVQGALVHGLDLAEGYVSHRRVSACDEAGEVLLNLLNWCQENILRKKFANSSTTAGCPITGSISSTTTKRREALYKPQTLSNNKYTVRDYMLRVKMSQECSYVLVTGASGFLGVNIMRYLAERQRKVLGTTRNVGGPEPSVEDYLKGLEDYVDWIEIDLTDFEKVMSIADKYKLNGVIHAAFTTPGTIEVEQSRSREILTNNLMGTVNTLELAREAGARRFVFVSSSGLYPNTVNINKPVPEDSPQPYLHMKGFYHITKIAVEKLTERYSQLFPMTTTSMRIPVIYGPMERPTRSRRAMGPIFRLLKLVVTDKKKTIRVKGLDYISDWTYVMDAAKGLIAGLDAPEPISHIYNISCGVNSSLVEFLTAIQRVPGVNFEWEEVEEDKDADFTAPVGRMRGPLSIEKARKELGFNPQYDPKQGVREYSEWWMGVTRRGLWLHQ